MTYTLKSQKEECIAGGEHNIISISSNFEEPTKMYGKCSKCGEFIPLSEEDL